MVMGAIGPALLLAVVGWFAWRGFSTAMRETNAALTDRALATNLFAARYVARDAANELEARFRLVEQTAAGERFRRRLVEMLADPEMDAMLARLADPNLDGEEAEKLRKQFRENPKRRELQQLFAAALPKMMLPDNDEAVQSWFFCDSRGTSLVRVPEGRTIGMNFAWRSYFHGGIDERPKGWRPAAGEHLRATSLSAVFLSLASSRWIAAVSTPVYEDAPLDEKDKPAQDKFLGVLAMTTEVGRFVQFPNGDEQFAVLVDNRPGENKGVILQHPLFDALLEKEDALPERFKNYRVAADDLPDVRQRQEHYSDPLAVDPRGGEFNRHWLARMEPVRVRGRDTGWLVIVQQDYDFAIRGTLERLSGGLIRSGLIALGLIALVMAGLWTMAKKLGGAGED